MKLKIISDVHLEFGEYTIPYGEDDKTTILIIAGDLHVGMGGLGFIDAACDRFYKVIYVLGNHEFYRHNYDDIKENWLEVARNTFNLHVLENDKVTIDGVTFLGATLWTDCNGGDWFTIQNVKNGMNDYRLIKGLDIQRMLRVHGESRDYLAGQAHEARVIITHHLPVQKCIAPQYVGNPINGGFVCADMEYINPDLWIYGHTHDANDFEHKGTRFVCNPRGYYGYESTVDYEPLEIEI